ncbi:glycosyltransferase [Chlamydiota bacterium]
MILTKILQILFWSSFIILFYTYIGYPLVIYLWSLVKPRPNKKGVFLPFISIVMSVYNEERFIQYKIQNLLSLDYPRDRLEVVIISDGSTDRTVELIQPFLSNSVSLIENSQRKGKAYSLNEAHRICKGEILCFTDVRQKLEENAISELMNNFFDATVGAVSGELIFVTGKKTLVGEGLDFYWRYEKFLRKRESLVDSTTGATGGIYAIRKELFQIIPEDIILDDVLIPMQGAVIGGYRCVFEEEAKAFDLVSNSSYQEAQRKTRTIAGNFQLFSRYKWLNPHKNRIWFQTFSHKFLRLIAPLLLLFLLFSNSCLYQNWFYFSTLLMQIGFYYCGSIGFFLKRKGIKIKLFTLPYTFIMLNYFTIKAFWLFFVCGNVIWVKDRRKRMEDRRQQPFDRRRIDRERAPTAIERRKGEKERRQEVEDRRKNIEEIIWID